MQLKRTDMVRAAVQKILDGLDDREKELRGEVAQARDRFVVAVTDDLSGSRACKNAAEMIGGAEMFVDVRLEPTDDVLAREPDSVPVVVRDGDPHTCSLTWRTVVEVEGPAREAMRVWLDLERELRGVQEQGRRVRDHDAKARAAIVDDALGMLPEGAEVLAALKKFTAALKLAEKLADE